MKERPILFSGPMVRALLREVDPKTMTRRVVKLPDAPNHLGDWEPTFLGGDGTTTDSRGVLVPRIEGIWHTRTGKFIKCPYGQPGDRLWVKETWREPVSEGSGYIDYLADHITKPSFIIWRPSIFMPRKFSRILLEITAVRVERLQEISEEDAKAEGWPVPELGTEISIRKAVPVIWFCDLWDSINAKRGYSWKSNPFCWVVEFKRITTRE
ncbi:hypothetical protein LCGC14_0386240 [marine sediment metagenome]|uniref:ASCH domain-containing protein n=1 Tax=marine sediment metagenome TaxID=412755 RepID=A0A0F9T0V5_9ZZZZ